MRSHVAPANAPAAAPKEDLKGGHGSRRRPGSDGPGGGTRAPRRGFGPRRRDGAGPEARAFTHAACERASAPGARYPTPPASAARAAAQCPPDCTILLQPITFDAASGKWVAVGDGPFKRLFLNGVAPDDPQFSGTRLSPEMFVDRPSGSVGAAKGGPFKNFTERDVSDIDVTGKKGNTFKDSEAGGGWTVKPDTNAAGEPTLMFKADAGKELKPGQTLWMRVPRAPQPGDTAATLFRGRLTPPAPAPAPAPKADEAPSIETGCPTCPQPRLGPLAPAALVPSVTFNSASNLLSFGPADVQTAEYVDGTTVSANTSFETIIGSSLTITDMPFLGASPDVPGAFRLGDAGVRVRQGSTSFLAATLTDILLLPGRGGPGFDSRLHATLVWDEVNQGAGSRYLREYFAAPTVSALFFDSNLLGATAGLTASGTSLGAADICATATPEPATWLLVGAGVVSLAGLGRRRRPARRLTP